MGMIVVNSDPLNRAEINPRKHEFYLLCVDPGLDNGMAALAVSPERVTCYATAIERWEPPYTDVIYRLRYWVQHLHTAATPCVLLYESFNLVSGELVPDLSALEVIGALKIWHEGAAGKEGTQIAEEAITRLPVTKQGKSEKGVRGVTDNVLRHLDLYERGGRERHVRDAIRHGIGYLAEERHPWVCARGWPQRKD